MAELGEALSAEEFDEWGVYFEIKEEREEARKAERKKTQGKPQQPSMGKSK